MAARVSGFAFASLSLHVSLLFHVRKNLSWTPPLRISVLFYNLDNVMDAWMLISMRCILLLFVARC